MSLSPHLTGEDISPVQDDEGGVWDLFPPAWWAQSRDSAQEVAYPKRLVQQVQSGEELAHDRLDTRAKSAGGAQPSVSLSIDQNCSRNLPIGRGNMFARSRATQMIEQSERGFLF